MRVYIALIALLGLLASGCASAAAAYDEGGKPQVVATISVIADVAAAVGGEAVEVHSLVDIGGDPHTYEPVPSDAGRIADADLILRNGLGLEHWLDTLIDASGSEQPTVTVSDGIVPLDGNGDTPDPHLWMDPHYVSKYADHIAAALGELVPAERKQFAARARTYKRELDALDRHITRRLATVPAERRRLVTTHDAFRYFGKRYGIEVAGTIWSVSTEREPSAAEIATLVEAVRTQGVPTVFVETTINPDLMQQVAASAGVGVGPPLYGDSLGAPGSGADTYVGMMKANTEALVAGLSKGSTP